LDCDCRLVGEGSHQLDLFGIEWTYLGARQYQNADGDALTQHWNSKHGAKAAQPLCLRPGVVRIRQHIGNVNDLALEQCSPVSRPTFRRTGYGADVIHKLGREAISLCAKEFVADLPRYGGLISLTQACRRFDQRLKQRPEVECRAADDFQHVGDSGLLLQRLAQLVEEAGVLNGDDRLVGEVLDQLNLLVGERTDFLAIDGNGADELIRLEHWHESQCVDAGELDCRDGQRMAVEIRLVFPQVSDLKWLSRPSNAAHWEYGSPPTRGRQRRCEA